MRYFVLLGCLVLAGVGYSGYWFFLASEIESRADLLKSQTPDPISDIRFENLIVEGYPYRLVTRADDPVVKLAGDKTSLTWKGPSVAAFTHPWTLNHILAQFPGQHRFAFVNDQMALAFHINAAAAQASRVGGGRELGRIALELGTVDVSSPAGDKLAALHHLQFNLRQAPDKTKDVQIALQSAKLTLAAGVMPRFPTRHIDTVQLLARFKNGFPKAWQAAAVQTWLENGGRLQVSEANIIFGNVQISAKGDLVLDDENRLSGDMEAEIKGHQALVAGLAKAGLIAEEQRSFVQTALGLMAAGNGGKITLPLRFADGIAWFGPVKIGDLHPLF